MASGVVSSAALAAPAPPYKRWLQLCIGIACCALVANLQYGWTLFVNPMQTKYGWTPAALATGFLIFIQVETWLVPVEGFLVEKVGPRLVTLGGALFCAAGWAVNSTADSLAMLYFGQVLAGIGGGAVYGTCVGHAVRWFPDKRGLASGLTAAGFGGGAALTIIPISHMIQSGGYERAFLVFGLVQGLGVFLLALFLIAPRKGEVPPPPPRRARGRNATPWQTLSSPIFWVMYVMYVLMAVGGLTMTSQLAPIAKSYGISDTTTTLLWTGATINLALSFRSILNGVSRPLFGWISDHLGRENTMGVAFALEGFAFWGLLMYGKTPLGFVAFSALTFFFYGEIYSLFPAAVGDLFGTAYATTNTGSMYTAKGTASLIGPYFTILAAKTGGWDTFYYIIIASTLLASFLAIFALKPMVRAMIRRQAAEGGPDAGVPAPAGRH